MGGGADKMSFFYKWVQRLKKKGREKNDMCGPQGFGERGGSFVGNVFLRGFLLG